ncbi:MAG: hypothetical protein KC445_07065 [Anaerolineales bacterium]|nr:hypothetical protein [Anaerolineales bacterium]
MKKMWFLIVGLVLGFLVASGWAGSVVAKFGGVNVPPTITVMQVEDAPVVQSTIRPYVPPTPTRMAALPRIDLGGAAGGPVKRDGWTDEIKDGLGSSGGRHRQEN